MEEQASEITNLQSELDSARSRIGSLLTDVREIERTANEGEVHVLVDDPELAIYRIASHVALLSLLTNYGGYQTTTSPAGEACIDYYLIGAGSLTDCGWQRVE